MRLKHVYVSEYKNLRNFSLDLSGDNFVDIFVGKNGSGKSNLLELLLLIFEHILSFDSKKEGLLFDYRIRYEIDGTELEIAWEEGQLSIDGRARKMIGKTPIPETLLVYYSGHNSAVGSLIEAYEQNFEKKIKGSDIEDSRSIIGIGTKYKELLLAVLLMQQDNCKAREFIKNKLGITILGIGKPGSSNGVGGQVRSESILRVTIDRPDFANGRSSKEYDVEPGNDETKYWRAEGVARTFLERLENSISRNPGGLDVDNGYFSSEDQYRYYYDVTELRREFGELTPLELFKQFDNLKTLGMLSEISMPMELSGGVDGSVKHFSDGQFQSVYIFAITELFKDKNCITLLDEPDAFLHPEWQFEFLSQIDEISAEAAQSNHILMSSHSASTISKAAGENLRLMECCDGKATTNSVEKSQVISSLSAGLISFTEGEARLNIQHILKNTNGPVLFTEGITDEMILETAWDRLYPSEPRPFEVQGAYDRGFLRNLFARDELKTNYEGRTMVALFDFDDAYDDWNKLKAFETGVLLEADPMKGLCKQLQHETHYAALLPVPDIDAIKPQILDERGEPWGRGVDSYLSIEILFYKESLLGEWFRKQAMPGGGEIIKFSGDKTRFASEFIPTLPKEDFVVFIPLFEFMKSKCDSARAVA